MTNFESVKKKKNNAFDLLRQDKNLCSWNAMGAL